MIKAWVVCSENQDSFLHYPEWVEEALEDMENTDEYEPEVELSHTTSFLETSTKCGATLFPSMEFANKFLPYAQAEFGENWKVAEVTITIGGI